MTFLGQRLQRGGLVCPSLACSLPEVLIYFSINVRVLGHTDSLTILFRITKLTLAKVTSDFKRFLQETKQNGRPCTNRSSSCE